MGFFLDFVNRMPASWIRTAGAIRGKSRWIKKVTDWVPNILRNQEGTIQKGLGRGLRFNGGNSAVGFVLGTHDTEIQSAFSRLIQPGMTVYDIGANVGFTAMLAAKKVAPTGRVICFEPLAANAEQILRNAALNHFSFVEVRQMALGQTDGEAEFLLSDSPTWGRLAQAGAAPAQSGKLRVPVRSLDSLRANDQLPAVHFIKMDVEGAEADVLLGGKALLRSDRPVLVIELHHTYEAVMKAFEGLDYTVRPLTATGKVASTDDEFQILAYPNDRKDVDSVWVELASGKMEF
jgi:FkbM family methyltransferase